MDFYSLGSGASLKKMCASWHRYENHDEGRVIWRQSGVYTVVWKDVGWRETDTEQVGE